MRFRSLSLVALIVLALSITSFLGLRSAEAFEMRGQGNGEGFPQPVFGAEALRLGVNVALEQYDDATLEARLSDLSAHGIQYLRQEFRWNDIERTPGAYDWAASDRIFRAAVKHGLRVLPVLWTTPTWARMPSASHMWPPIETAPPADVDNFAHFAGAFAERYDRPQTANSGQIRSPIIGFQIWDEPNLSAAWGNALIDPTYYLQLLRAARGAIRTVDPRAQIVLAALAPTSEQTDVNLAPQTFLLKLYQLGGHESFEIAAAKPYGFASPPDDRRTDPATLNFSHVILMREVMVAHGDGHKAIWATSFGWSALPAHWQGEPSVWGSVSEVAQAQYTTEAVQRVAREWPWLGAMYIENLQPRPRPKEPASDPHWGFALLAQDGQPRPVYQAFAEANKGAALAPRAQLFAACVSPQSMLRTLRLENVTTGEPEVRASKPDCQAPNPLALFSAGWRFDQLGADVPDRTDAKVSVHFNGDALALIVRRGPYRAYTFVAIDGQPANALPREERGAYLVMNSAGQYPVIETIPVARALAPGAHVADIVVDRGWNQWALIGWSSAVRASNINWAILRALAAVIGILALAGLVWSAPRAQWRAGLVGLASRVGGRQIDPAKLTATALIAALTYWLAASLTWAQDAATAYRNLGTGPNIVIPGLAAVLAFWSPVMVVSLVALVVLLLLVLLRLDVGLALVAFFIPFYLQPQRLFERAFSMVELLTLMCAASWVMAQALALTRRRKPTQTSSGRRTIDLSSAFRRLTVLDVSVLALVFVSLLSASQAQFQVEAFREWRTVIVEPALVYVMLRLSARARAGTARDERAVRIILFGYLSGALVVALVGLANDARGITFSAEFGLPRLMGVFNSANNDALYLERASAMLFAFAVFGRWPAGIGVRLALLSARSAYCVALVPVTLALLLTQSRGALLFGLPIAVVVMFVVAGGRWRIAGLAVLALGVVAIGLISLGALRPVLEATRFARIANAFDLSSGSGFVRINLWQSALTMWRDHPLLGVGPDNFLYAYRSFYILPVAWNEPNLSHPHNIVLDFATRLGVLGLATGMGLIGGYAQLVKEALRLSHTGMRDPGAPPSRSDQTAFIRPLAIGCAGFLAAMLAHGMVDHALFLIELAFPFMVTAGLLAWEVASREA